MHMPVILLLCAGLHNQFGEDAQVSIREVVEYLNSINEEMIRAQIREQVRHDIMRDLNRHVSEDA